MEGLYKMKLIAAILQSNYITSDINQNKHTVTIIYKSV